MSDNKTSIFDQYTASKAMTAADVAAEESAGESGADDRATYHAFGVSKIHERQTRLRIHYQDGTVAVMSYAYLMEVLCTSQQYLSLIYTSTILTLEGRHLEALIEPLQDEKIRSLHCFHAKYFADPAEDAPVITRIERQGAQDLAR
jgi:hypothetical protein